MQMRNIIRITLAPNADEESLHVLLSSTSFLVKRMIGARESSQPGGCMKEAAVSSSSEEVREKHARFVQENLRRIFLQIYRIVGNVDDAQDLAQETFIKALQREDQLKDLNKAAHWLSRIASNTAIDFLRRHGRVSFSDLGDLLEQPRTRAEESPERLVLRAEQSAFLSTGLGLLSERERTALLLRDVDGLSSEEVAATLRCSKATVRSHIANARIKFRRYLERSEGRKI
jgi:RNA polymerase sigma-70 factor (ECF subfamily)